MPTTVTVRRSSRRRRPRRKKWPIAVGVLAPVLLLAALAIYFATQFPKQVQKVSYPLKYREQIEHYAEEYGLDPARVAAVMFCESSFVPDAVSNVGARGLMQIMPETGEWLATKFPDMEYTGDMLFDPDVSLQFGCWYLNWLDARYDGDLANATAAYHNGQGNVDKWLADPANSSDGKTLDYIPSSATDTYVKRVLRAYENYKELFNEKQS